MKHDPTKIALIGDRDDQIAAHTGIGLSMERLREEGWPIETTWVAPSSIGDLAALSGFHGFWCVPGSPYSSTEGALAAIGYAREHLVPFLGTWGGFQHAALEYARNVIGLGRAEHEEMSPGAEQLVISQLSCSMVEVTGRVRLSPASKAAALTGVLELDEGYHCNYV